MTPTTPKISNARRHDTYDRTQVTSSGVNAPPHRADNHNVACARSRWRFGSHVVNTRVRFGKQPASPAPKSVRVMRSEVMFQTQPVAAVKIDHQTTIRMSTRRGPSLSPSQPPGTSNSAYAHPNTENAHPICVFEMPSDSCIAGAACE